MSKSPPRNLLVPFRRDRVRDFASGTGDELMRAKVLQVLLTEGDTPQSSGELPWRTAFGSGLHLLRHRNADEVLVELARLTARDALRRWVLDQPPHVQVRIDSGHLHLQLGTRLDGESRERPQTVKVDAIDIDY